MTVTATPIFPQSVINTGQAIYHGTGTVILFGATNTSTGTLVPFFVPGANGAMLTGITVVNLDTATCTMALIVTASSTFQVLGIYAIAGGGTATNYAVSPTNLLSGTQGLGNSILPFDSCGNRILYVAAGSTLNVGLLNTIISTGAQLSLTVLGGNF